MNRRIERMLLAGVCWGAVAAAAVAQSQHSPGDEALRPSHRPLQGGVSDLAGAEDLLAQRLHHTHDLQEIQDFLNKPAFQAMLKEKINDLNPDDIKTLQEAIQKDPKLLDDPALHNFLKDAEKLKQDETLKDLPKDTKDEVLKLAKDLLGKQKSAASGAGDPTTGGPMSRSPSPAPQPLTPPPPPARIDKFSQPPLESSPSNWVTHDLAQGVTGLIKDIDRTPEGEALRAAALRELDRMDLNSSSGLADFLKHVLSSDQAAWLARTGKPPSAAGLGGWNLGASTAPSVGGASDGLMDGVVWIAALGMLIAAGWMAVAVARRRAASRTRARPWSAGPWPVSPAQVSTRQDLIRAFEHLAYLLLGPGARSLNHLDVAGRLGRDDGRRAEAADRLAHLYEQARYAPPDEVMPLHELTAARGDLTALAGAAA